MAKNFNLTAAPPEPLTVNAFDGREHVAKSPAEFGLADYARLMALKETIAGMVGVNITTLTVEKALAVESIMDEFLQMIVPTFPPEQRARMNFGHKQQLINWWLAEVGTKKAEGSHA